MKSLSQINLTEPDRQAASDAARTLRAHFPVEQVILFGSKARGQSSPDSDMDLLILLHGQRPADASRRVWEVLWDVQMRHAVGLSPLVVSADQWRDGPYQAMLLKQEVERDGVLL